MRSLRALMLIAVSSIGATAGYAECVTAISPWGVDISRYGFVFDGTVLQLNDAGIAQMQVHRVFKGRLPARLELHAFQSIEDTPIAAGQRYVMAIQRKAPGFPSVVPNRPFAEPEDDPTLVWGTLPCAAALRDALQRHGALEGLGPGWPPER